MVCCGDVKSVLHSSSHSLLRLLSKCPALPYGRSVLSYSVLFNENAPLLGRPGFLILFSILLRPGAAEAIELVRVDMLDARLSLLLLVGEIGESSSSTLPVLDELTSHCSLLSIMRATSADMASR